MWGLLAFIGVVVTVSANLIIGSVDADIEKMRAVCLWLFGAIWILAGSLGVYAYNSKRRELDLTARVTRELYELRSEIEDLKMKNLEKDDFKMDDLEYRD